MHLIYVAILLAIIAAICDWWIGLKDPWRKIVLIGIVILFAVGVLQLLLPGFLF